MILKKYCLILLGKIIDESHRVILNKITEGNVNVVSDKGIEMVTFNSVLAPSEIRDLFLDYEFSVIIFNLDDNYSSVRINNKEKTDKLFPLNYTNMESTESNLENVNLGFIDDLSKGEKDKLLNSIIDKGINNLSDEDRLLLSAI